MRKSIIRYSICLLCISAFSQEKAGNKQEGDSTSIDSVKTIVASFSLKLDQVDVTLWKRFFSDKNIVLVSTIRVEKESISFFEGKQLQLNKHIRIIPELGFTYLYRDNLDFRFRTELRVSFENFYSQINYFYQREQASVSSRTMYLVDKVHLAFGLESQGDYLGPRLELRFSLRKDNPIPIGIHGNYLNDNFGFGIDINPLDFLSKKKKQQLKELEDKINIFN